MPFLTSDQGRHELTPGTDILGGRDAGSVGFGTLRELPAAASITVAPPGCTLRVGSVKLRFRPSVTAPAEGYGTRRVVGFAERLSKLINEE